jgi:predicted GNAT superfamily acetyltransferase
MTNVTLADGTVIRPLATHDERAEAVRIQEETWGATFSERIPAAMLLVAEETGGIAAAAFSPDGRMLGFIFGVSGVRGGALVHWSDMLAVRAEAQGRRLGEALKRYQRDRCRALGVDAMYWTYDPFVARNAHINLNILGAAVDEFVPDMYGAVTNSPMHGSLGTDRFIVRWAVRDEPAPMSADPVMLSGAVAVGGSPRDVAADASLPAAPLVTVRIPRDYQALLSGDVAMAKAWRVSARRAFAHYLALGYRVTAFVSGGAGDATYLLSAR